MNSTHSPNTDTWVSRLGHESPVRDSAIEELRGYLVRGLNKALKGRYGGKVQIDDVVQMALLKILRSLNTFKGNSNFTTWAMAIAVRTGISELRRRYYRDVSLDLSRQNGELQFEPVAHNVQSEHEKSVKHDLLGVLRKAIDETLTERQRIAIQGSLEGLPVEEIALRLNSNRNAVYKLVHDARLKLRHDLESQGITAEDIAVGES